MRANFSLGVLSTRLAGRVAARDSEKGKHSSSARIIINVRPWIRLATIFSLNFVVEVFKDLSIRKNLSIGYTRKFRTKEDFGDTFLSVLWPEILTDIDRPVSKLSGGMRQLVAVSRVLLTNAKFLLLDEPTAGMSTRYSRAVLKQIRHQIDAGSGAIIVEHRIARCLEFCDRIIVLRRGVVTYDGSTKGIASLADLKDFYV